MAKDDKNNDGANINFNFGNLGLGGLFKGIENLVDLAAKLKDTGGEINKEGEVDLSNLKEGMKGVFGVLRKNSGWWKACGRVIRKRQENSCRAPQ